MRSMATQTDVNNHKNQRHSLHYPLGSPGSYADEKVRFFYIKYNAIGDRHLHPYIYKTWSNDPVLGANGIRSSSN